MPQFDVVFNTKIDTSSIDRLVETALQAMKTLSSAAAQPGASRAGTALQLRTGEQQIASIAGASPLGQQDLRGTMERLLTEALRPGAQQVEQALRSQGNTGLTIRASSIEQLLASGRQGPETAANFGQAQLGYQAQIQTATETIERMTRATAQSEKLENARAEAIRAANEAIRLRTIADTHIDPATGFRSTVKPGVVEDAEAQAAQLRQRAVNLSAQYGPKQEEQEKTSSDLLAKRVEAESSRLGVAQRILLNDNGSLDLSVQRRAAEQQLNETIAERVKGLRGTNQGGFFGGIKEGFLETATGGRGGGGVNGFLSNLGGQLGGYGGFAVSAALFYRLGSTMREMVHNAEDFQIALGRVQAQMESVGQGEQFSQIKDKIQQVAGATGISNVQVAGLAQEFLGLFGNVNQASQAIDDAAKLIRVIGSTATEAGPQIGALAQDLDASVNEIGNAVVDITNRTGRSGQDAIAALSGVAPVANELGLTLNQTRGIIEGIAAGSARSGQQIGEGLARTLPELQKNLPKLAQLGINISPEARAGDATAAIEDILKGYGQLDKAHQQFVANLLGGPRFTQIFAAALADPTKALALFNSTELDNDGLNHQFQKNQETLRTSLDRLRTSSEQLGEIFIEGPLGKGLRDLVNIGGQVIHWATDFLSAINTLNNDTGGFVLRLGEVYAALRLISALNIPTALEGLLTLVPTLSNLTTVGSSTAGVAAGTSALEAGGVGAAGAAGATGLSASLGVGTLATAGIVAAAAAVLAASSKLSDVATNTQNTVERNTTNRLDFGSRYTPGQGPLAPYSNTQLQDLLTYLQGVAGVDRSFKPSTAFNANIEPFTLGQAPGHIVGGAGDVESNIKSVKAVLAERVSKQYQAQAQALLDAGFFDKSDADKLRKDLEKPTDFKSANELQRLTEAASQTATGKKILALQRSTEAQNKALDKVTEDLGVQVDSVTQVGQLFQEGDISWAQAQQAMQRIVDSTAGFPSGTQGAIDHAKAIVDQQKVVSQHIKDMTDSLKQLDQFLGTATPANLINIDIGAAANPGTTLSDKQTYLKDIYSQGTAAFQQFLANQPTIAQINTFLKNGPYTPQQQQQILTVLNQVDKAQGIAPTNKLPNILADPQLLEQARKARIQAIQQQADADAALGKAFAGNDQVAGANAALQAAQAELNALLHNGGSQAEVTAAQAKMVEAQNALQQATLQSIVDNTEADLSLAKAFDVNNPIKIANDELQAAQAELNADLANGASQAVVTQAQAKVEEIKNSVIQAQQDFVDSQFALTESQQKARGDVVGAAKTKLADLQSKLNTLPTGTAAYNNLLAQIQDQQASIVDTQIQQIESTIHTQLDLHKITLAQAVDQLRKAESLTQDQSKRDQIELEIQNLLQQGASGLEALGVPSSIKLPSLYEVRRFQATTQGGIGYQDNRQISVQLTVANGMNEAQAKQMLSEAFSTGSQVFGTTTRLF